MTLETIMQILYNNNLTDVIVLATAIDSNIVSEEDKKVGDMITVNVSKETLTKMGLQPKANKEGRGFWYNVQLPVLAVNKYALKNKYLVTVAGKNKWTENEIEKSGDGEVELIPVPVELPNSDSYNRDNA